MKRLIVDIYEESDGKLSNMVDITSDDLCVTYSNFNGMHGLQCNFEGGTPEFQTIENWCRRINNAIRVIYETNILNK